MSFLHDKLAHATTRELLRQLREGQATWATDRLTATTTFWHGISDWPQPDGAFEDRSTGSSLAFEFKPPGQSKREYVTGLGQIITYLQEFEYAALVVPVMANDRYKIAEYLKTCLEQPFFSNLPVGLFAYDTDPGNASDLRPLVNLRPRPGTIKPIPKGVGRKIFWAYWRDLSQHDLFTILREMSTSDRKFDKVFKKFWNQKMVKGKARNWEGGCRKKKSKDTKSFSAERLNAFMSLRHINVIDSDGNVTDEGYNLLHCGKVYGSASKAFMGQLARHVLESGKHLELIFWVDEQQRNIASTEKSKAKSFYRALDQCMQDAGIIPRVPSGEGKPSFFRDEAKLWNKLGLLVRDGPRYFKRGTGLIFDWRTIVSIIG